MTEPVLPSPAQVPVLAASVVGEDGSLQEMSASADGAVPVRAIFHLSARAEWQMFDVVYRWSLGINKERPRCDLCLSISNHCYMSVRRFICGGGRVVMAIDRSFWGRSCSRNNWIYCCQWREGFPIFRPDFSILFLGSVCYMLLRFVCCLWKTEYRGTLKRDRFW